MTPEERIAELEAELESLASFVRKSHPQIGRDSDRMLLELRRKALSSMAVRFQSREETCDLLQFYVDQTTLKAVLIQRGSHMARYPNYWAIPGGHVDRDEHPAVAALREYREETGLEPGNDIHYLGLKPIPDYYPTYLYVSVIHGETGAEYVNGAKLDDETQDIELCEITKNDDDIWVPVIKFDSKGFGLGPNHTRLFHEAVEFLHSENLIDFEP